MNLSGEILGAGSVCIKIIPVPPLQCISCDSNSVTGMQAPVLLLRPDSLIVQPQDVQSTQQQNQLCLNIDPNQQQGLNQEPLIISTSEYL